MSSQELRQRIFDIGIIPVVRATSAEFAQRAAEAVCAGGIPIVEITMTVPGAVDLIRRLSQSIGKEVVIGAGTVLNQEAANRCIDAGAQFLVSPGFDERTLRLASARNVLTIPGALTPTEIMAARAAGADIIKVFPCGTVGGAKYIKALKGPFPDVPLIPTGGVNLETAASFVEAGAFALGVGGELISASALESGNVHEITDNARKFVNVVRAARARSSPVAGTAT